jgi:hypothetical protein
MKMGLTQKLKVIGFGTLLLAEAATEMIGSNIAKEAENYNYDKRTKIEINQETINYREKLGEALCYVGLGSFFLTGTIGTGLWVASDEKQKRGFM